MTREKIAALFVAASLLLVATATALYRRAAIPGAGEAEVVVLNLTGVASDGVWTLEPVNGLNYWWKTFEPATIYLREGDEVVLNLHSADLLHGFYIPAFSVGPVDVKPGHMVTVRFTASRTGVFQYYCTSMCGGCHFYMRGWIVVTAEGEEPATPPPILCTLCRPGAEAPPEEGDTLAFGAFLYRERGCVTCHGVEGRGGVINDNSASTTVPAHDTTAEKLFLASQEDAEAFMDLVSRVTDLDSLEEPPPINRYPIVRVRFDNAKEIIRTGRYTGRLEPAGPVPPLQMPAWEFLLEEKDINTLLVYFVSLYPWEEET